jgi:hypothetical protein
MIRTICILGCLGFLAASGCASKDAQNETSPPLKAEAAPTPDSKPQVSSSTPSFLVTRFPTAADAFRHLIKTTDPRVIGVGEIHQKDETSGIRSALVRFTDELLPVAADRTSDLVVETWVSTGSCGETEKKMTKEVAKVTERPAETENETVRLLKAAVKQNIAPHVLKMTCDDYRRIYEAEGGTDYFLLLETVGDHLGKEAQAALDARKKQGNDAKPMTLIYGGALHNDASPSEMWKTVTYGPSLVSTVGASRYLEIDLIVPEFAEKSKVLEQEAWMPTVRKAASKTDVALIQLGERSFLLVLPFGVAAKKNAASQLGSEATVDSAVNR